MVVGRFYDLNRFDLENVHLHQEEIRQAINEIYDCHGYDFTGISWGVLCNHSSWHPNQHTCDITRSATGQSNVDTLASLEREYTD